MRNTKPSWRRILLLKPRPNRGDRSLMPSWQVKIESISMGSYRGRKPLEIKLENTTAAFTTTYRWKDFPLTPSDAMLDHIGVDYTWRVGCNETSVLRTLRQRWHLAKKPMTSYSPQTTMCSRLHQAFQSPKNARRYSMRSLMTGLWSFLGRHSCATSTLSSRRTA